MSSRTCKFTLGDEAAGSRLDKVLAGLLPDSSRTFLQKLIKEEQVRCDGKITTSPRFSVNSNMNIEVEIPEAEALVISPEPFAFPILFEDDSMVIIDKPAGVVVHPAPGNTAGTVVNALLSRYPDLAADPESGERPGIVHRLDKDTSGCLVIAKSPSAQFILSKEFADRKVKKSYLAIVRGIPPELSGEITTLIGRHPVNRQKMAVVERNGKTAITRYQVMDTGTFEGVPVSLVEVWIATGRTHQIRVHMSHLGFPVAGDALYGGDKGALGSIRRQLLHAWKIELPHPVTGNTVRCTSPIPEDFSAALEKSGINMGN